MKIISIPTVVSVSPTTIQSDDLPFIRNNPAAIRIFGIYLGLQQANLTQSKHIYLNYAEGKFSWITTDTPPDPAAYCSTITTISRYLCKAGFFPIQENTPPFAKAVYENIQKYIIPQPNFGCIATDLLAKTLEYLTPKQVALFFKATLDTSHQTIIRNYLQLHPEVTISLLTYAYGGIRNTPIAAWAFLQSLSKNQQWNFHTLHLSHLLLEEEDLPHLITFMPQVRSLSLAKTYINQQPFYGHILEGFLEAVENLHTLSVEVQSWETQLYSATSWIKQLQHFTCLGHRVKLDFRQAELPHLTHFIFHSSFPGHLSASLGFFKSASNLQEVSCQDIDWLTPENPPKIDTVTCFSCKGNHNLATSYFKFGHLKNLQELTLTASTDQSKIIWPTTGLQKLTFVGTEESAQGIQRNTTFYECLLQNSDSLRTVSFSYIHMEEFSQHWPLCPNLEELLIEAPWTSFVLPKNLLYALPNLKRLTLIGTIVNDCCDIDPSQIELPSIPLNLQAITLHLLFPFQELEKWLLQSPYIAEIAVDITLPSSYTFKNNFPSVTTLTFCSSDEIDTTDMPQLQSISQDTAIFSLLTSCSNTQELTLRGVQITSEQWSSCSFPTIRKLHLINLEHDEDEDNNQVPGFSIMKFPGLKVLIIEGTTALLNLRQFTKSMPSQGHILEELHLHLPSVPRSEENHDEEIHDEETYDEEMHNEEIYTALLQVSVPTRAFYLTQTPAEDGICIQHIAGYIENNPHIEHLSLACNIVDNQTAPPISIELFSKLKSIALRAPKANQHQVWDWIRALQHHPTIEIRFI